MRQLSIGMDSTLGNWRKMSLMVFGEDSPQVKFFDDKITKQGEDEEVIADEGQLLHVLMSMEK